MSAPDVSVIIPTRNRAPLVRRAVQSALAAARPGDEIIVVDDGSTDETARSLDAYVDRIRYVRSAQVGPGAARNLGIREARSDLVAFLDSDDEWMPDKLALQRALMCTSTVLVRRQEAGERGLPGGARLAAGLRIRRDRRRAARLRAQVSGARSGRHAVGRRRGRSRAGGDPGRGILPGQYLPRHPTGGPPDARGRCAPRAQQPQQRRRCLAGIRAVEAEIQLVGDLAQVVCLVPPVDSAGRKVAPLEDQVRPPPRRTAQDRTRQQSYEAAARRLIDTFLLSCRVLGRGVERALAAAICRVAAARGVRRLRGEYIRTPRNTPAADFYREIGLEEVESETGRSVWRLDLPSPGALAPPWIALRFEGDGR